MIKSFDEKKQDFSIQEIQNLKSDLKNWLEFYTIMSGKSTIKPYIHAFVFHIPEFLEKFKKLSSYNFQGLEKLNDFHNSTN